MFSCQLTATKAVGQNEHNTIEMTDESIPDGFVETNQDDPTNYTLSPNHLMEESNVSIPNDLAPAAQLTATNAVGQNERDAVAGTQTGTGTISKNPRKKYSALELRGHNGHVNKVLSNVVYRECIK